MNFKNRITSVAVVGAAALCAASQVQAATNYDLSQVTTPLSNLASPPAPGGNTATLPITAPTSTLTFSNFSYSPSSSGGNTAVAASAIDVAGITSIGGQADDNGINFTSGNWYITNGSLDSDIMFQVTASSGTLINAVDLHFGASVHQANGSDLLAQVVETVSAIVGGNLTTVATLTVMDNGNNSSLDQTVQLPTGYSSLTINKDIQLLSVKSNDDNNVDGQFYSDFNANQDTDNNNHNSASASFSYVTNSFYTEPSNTGSGVPEPASLGLLGVGAVGLLMRRRARAKESLSFRHVI